MKKENFICQNARWFQFSDLWVGASIQHSLHAVLKQSIDALLKVSPEL